MKLNGSSLSHAAHASTFLLLVYLFGRGVASKYFCSSKQTFKKLFPLLSVSLDSFEFRIQNISLISVLKSQCIVSLFLDIIFWLIYTSQTNKPRTVKFWGVEPWRVFGQYDFAGT